jgi:hypothetical protein
MAMSKCSIPPEGSFQRIAGLYQSSIDMHTRFTIKDSNTSSVKRSPG